MKKVVKKPVAKKPVKKAAPKKVVKKVVKKAASAVLQTKKAPVRAVRTPHRRSRADGRSRVSSARKNIKKIAGVKLDHGPPLEANKGAFTRARRRGPSARPASSPHAASSSTGCRRESRSKVTRLAPSSRRSRTRKMGEWAALG